jgi:hypothetical protein
MDKNANGLHNLNPYNANNANGFGGLLRPSSAVSQAINRGSDVKGGWKCAVRVETPRENV